MTRKIVKRSTFFVVQTFALSKLWYTAQVLPLPAPVCKKIEAAVSSFIFRGRHERLKLSEIQNPPSKGGLSLTCVSTKSECLLLRQTLRILARPLQNSTKHLGHWLGLHLREVFPHLYEQGPVCQALVPQYPLHSAMLEALEEGLTRNEFTPNKLAEVTTKAIYGGRLVDVLPPPKVELAFPGVDFHELVYPRLSHAVLEPGPKDVLYCIVHGLYRNRERLFLQNRVNSPFCQVPECQGAVQNREHIFCSCSRVVGAWLWMRRRLLQMMHQTIGAAGTSNTEFILLQYPKDIQDKECIWLIGNYVEIVDNVTIGKSKNLNVEELKGVLRARLQGMAGRAVVQPNLYNL